MLYVWLLVGLVVIVVVVLVALGRGDSAVPAEPDARSAFLPDDRAVTPADVDALRLPQAVRGYRVADVDAVLDRLAAELRERDAALDLLDAAREAPARHATVATPAEHGVELVVPLPADPVDPAADAPGGDCGGSAEGAGSGPGVGGPA